jgi:hypothetical protein
MAKYILIIVVVSLLIIVNGKPYSPTYSSGYCISVERYSEHQCYCVNSCRNYTVNNWTYYNCPVYIFNPNCIITNVYGYTYNCLCQEPDKYPSCSSGGYLFID